MLRALRLLSLALVLVALPALAQDLAQDGPFSKGEQQDLDAKLADGNVKVDLYFPSAPGQYPIIALGHGMAGNKSGFAGWGRHLASWGFVVAVPQFPNAYNPDHAKNARILRELLDKWLPSLDRQQNSQIHGRIDATRSALLGHSAGALSAALALADRSSTTAAVFLDLVDLAGKAQAALPRVSQPAAFLFAEPQSCNQYGNAQAEPPLVHGPMLTLRVVGANHCDPMDPADQLCTYGCGAADPARGLVYKAYATAWLRRFLSNDDAQTATYLGGTRFVSDVQGHKISNQILTHMPGTPPPPPPPTGGPDAGTVTVDAGTPPDTGTTADAGVSAQPDAGASPSGTSSGIDAGEPVGGCNCGAGSVDALALALGALVLRRRRG